MRKQQFWPSTVRKRGDFGICLLLLVLLQFSICLETASAVDRDFPRFMPTKQSMNELVVTFGFITGQKLSLHAIAEQRPDLAARAKKLELLFDFEYRQPLASIHQLMTKTFGVERTREFEKQLIRQLTDFGAGASGSRNGDIEFLDLVETRISGQIESPVLETLLWLKYADRPEEEILDRHIRRFDSTGHRKALGLGIHLRLPISWRPDEGERPHIVQKWNSRNGHGSSTIMLMVRDAGGHAVTDKEMNDLLSSGDFSDMVPEGSKITDFGGVTVENRASIWFDAEVIMSRMQVQLPIKMRQYMIPHGERIVTLQCATFGNPGEAMPLEEFRSSLPICALVVNSLVIDEKYR